MRRAPAWLLAAVCIAGCTRAAPVRLPAPAPVLPPAAPPVESVLRTVAPGTLGFDERAERPVTFTAQDADVRRLLLLLAEAAGLGIVLPPEVQGRVSVHFEDVPARVALQQVLEQAGLGTTGGVATAPWLPVIFYPLPVNVNRVSAEAIHWRFEVSRELAEFLVRSRNR